ncbi:hypothetical protein FRD01_01275 [Microvenator marinus]|uniref:Uncharacterized protein n=1 Tax=Microvenator marinus TaxID=2600177 RepID=A0A5B8XPH0_9DELT|nr:hypothetical protein FRD01_01275 [Microvenator marinus]
MSGFGSFGSGLFGSGLLGSGLFGSGLFGSGLFGSGLLVFGFVGSVFGAGTLGFVGSASTQTPLQHTASSPHEVSSQPLLH